MNSAPSPLASLPFGTHPLPPGTLACLVTFLEMRARPARRGPERAPGGANLVSLADDVDRYLALYRRLGERWLWFSRLEIGREDLAAIIADPRVAAFAVVVEGRDCGLLELDFRQEGEAELAFFGLTEDVIGLGLGRWLMDEALALAWSRPISRLFVHTCNFDHPRAIAFYRSSGFAPCRLALEFVRDPRLTVLDAPGLFPDLPPA
ncbi:MAG: GNAT family N-acetyltransferase [Alsobacter sp.]